MQSFDYLIVGGGLAAVSAVEGIRSRDAEGSITILADEAEPPYHRPPLSKEYLHLEGVDREMLHVKPRSWFEEEGRVTLRTKERVISLDPKAMTVTTAGGSEYGAARILLATGGRPRTLPVPGSDLDGVLTFRTVDDAETLRRAASAATEAVLVGGGFIGMELAASLTKLGLRCTVVEREDRVWPTLFPPRLSRFVQGRFESRGVAFRLGRSVAELGGSGRVATAVLDSGEELPCQVAVVGIGILPNAELAARAGLAVQDGIVVDAYAESSHAHIYAAGDVARFPDPLFRDSVRVEHWDHARAHGRLAGRNMAGDREPYDHLSYFFTQAFDLSLNLFGRPSAADQLIVQGDLEGGSAVVFGGTQGRLTSAILVNANRELARSRELVGRAPELEELTAELEEARGESPYELVDADL